jgi:signal transduction histidine kinase
MNPELFQRFGAALRDMASGITDFLARLTFWRFAGLCFLLMIAAGIGNDLLLTSGKRHKPMIVINKERSVEKSEQTPEPPAIPEPPAAPEVPLPPEAKVGANGTAPNIEVRIGEDGIVVRGSKDLERLGRKIEERMQREIDQAVEEIEPPSGPDLPKYALFLIVLMIIARYISKSKLKAEAQTAVVRDIADREALSRQLAEARLQAMQAQVEPHFLFNTLAAVEHLIETDPPRAAKMQRNLIGYLRSVMPNFRKPESTLGREVDICRNYLEILKVRMEERLHVDINLPPELESASVPPLMLQSIVENAIRHGLEPKPEGGHLHLRAEAADGRLAITVVDTGTGFNAANAAANGRNGGGVGLSNIRERLNAMFGERGRLTISPNVPHGTQVRLEIPYPYTASGKGS